MSVIHNAQTGVSIIYVPTGAQGPPGDVNPQMVALLAATEDARDNAQAAALASDASADQAAQSAQAASGDSVQTGLDRIATASDRVQTGLDAQAATVGAAVYPDVQAALTAQAASLITTQTLIATHVAFV